MTPSPAIRPVLAVFAAASLSACGMVDSDPHRFENMADSIAAIPLDGQGARVAKRVAPTAESGSRPALRVEVMDPHALWDARDGGLNGIAREAAPQLAAAAAPAMAEAVVQNVSARIDGAATRLGLTPTVKAGPVPVDPPRALVQIGAYSSEASARAAWARLQKGAASTVVEGLTPVFEAVEVEGRRLTRLKVQAPASGAASLCAAAGIDDPWCRRAA